MANWSDLERLFELHQTNPEWKLFTETRLTRTAVYPNPIERQSVPALLQVVNDSTVASLELRHATDTSVFVSYILQFWKVCNVRSPNLDNRRNDKYLGAVFARDQWQLEFLRFFASQAKYMQPLTIRDHFHTLTRDTAVSLYHTYMCLCEITEFLFIEKVSFVMLGYFSTNSLEHHFGRFRLGCGGTYLVSVRAVFEKHRIFSATMLARFDSNSLVDLANRRSAVVHSCNFCALMDFGFVNAVQFLAGDISSELKRVLVYVAGYVSFAANGLSEDSEDTYIEYFSNREYLDKLNRGKLRVPSDTFVLFVYYCYIAFTINCDRGIPCYLGVHQICKAIAHSYNFFDGAIRKAACRTISNILLNDYTLRSEVPTSRESEIKRTKFS